MDWIVGRIFDVVGLVVMFGPPGYVLHLYDKRETRMREAALRLGRPEPRDWPAFALSGAIAFAVWCVSGIVAVEIWSRG